MGFGPAWRVQGTQIIPLGSIDTIKGPAAEQFNIESDAAFLVTDAGSAATKLKGEGNTRMQINGTGLAFFDGTPIARESKQPDLPGVASTAEIVTFVNALQASVVNYGLLA